MEAKVRKVPGADHPITIQAVRGKVIVTVAGTVIAESSRALALQEARYPPVYYLPKPDVKEGVLELSSHTSYCPYKGDCTYYHVVVGKRVENAAWCYETPYEAVAAIRDHVAFYPDKADSIALTG